MKNIKFISVGEAVKVIKSNDRVHLHSIAVTPHPLLKAMCERGCNKEFRNVRIQHIHTGGDASYADPEEDGATLQTGIGAILTPGTGLKSTRTNIHWPYTEYGTVNLYEKILQYHAKLIISFAHLNHQSSTKRHLNALALIFISCGMKTMTKLQYHEYYTYRTHRHCC